MKLPALLLLPLASSLAPPSFAQSTPKTSQPEAAEPVAAEAAAEAAPPVENQAPAETTTGQATPSDGPGDSAETAPEAPSGETKDAEGAPGQAPGTAGAGYLGTAAVLAGKTPAKGAAETTAPASPPEGKQGGQEPAEARDGAADLPRNTIAGHVFLSVRAGLAAPFGKIGRNTLQTEYAGVGWGFGADAGYGIGRDVAIGIYGDFLPLGTQPGCPDCSPSSFGVGAFVRYHLVSGLAFDPWASFGVGYRTLSLTDQGQAQDYSGLEWLRITFGGDFYPSRYVGFGPYMELGAGSFFSVPDGQRAGGVNYRFQMGLRIAVDFMGR